MYSFPSTALRSLQQLLQGAQKIDIANLLDSPILLYFMYSFPMYFLSFKAKDCEGNLIFIFNFDCVLFLFFHSGLFIQMVFD